MQCELENRKELSTSAFKYLHVNRIIHLYRIIVCKAKYLSISVDCIVEKF